MDKRRFFEFVDELARSKAVYLGCKQKKIERGSHALSMVFLRKTLMAKVDLEEAVVTSIWR